MLVIKITSNIVRTTVCVCPLRFAPARYLLRLSACVETF